MNTVYRYEEVADAYLQQPDPGWTRYPCVATGWDNTPRRQLGEATVLQGSTPEAYGRWLTGAVRQQMEQPSARIVFVNAWNEWAEGAHLEPDAFWGRAFLEETRRVLEEECGFVPPPSHDPEIDLDPTPTEDLYTTQSCIAGSSNSSRCRAVSWPTQTGGYRSGRNITKVNFRDRSRRGSQNRRAQPSPDRATRILRLSGSRNMASMRRRRVIDDRFASGPGVWVNRRIGKWPRISFISSF